MARQQKNSKSKKNKRKNRSSERKDNKSEKNDSDSKCDRFSNINYDSSNEFGFNLGPSDYFIN